MNPAQAQKLINSNPQLQSMAKKNSRLKWIIMKEYQAQVRERIKLIEAFIEREMTPTTADIAKILHKTDDEIDAYIAAKLVFNIDVIVKLCDELRMTRANEVDRILISFPPPASMFDMTGTALSHFHRLVKPHIGNKLMFIDRESITIYR